MTAPATCQVASARDGSPGGELDQLAGRWLRKDWARFGDDGARPGDRGWVLEAHTGFTGGTFDRAMPAVYVTDNGEVEFGECRVPLATFRAWAAAVVDGPPR